MQSLGRSQLRASMTPLEVALAGSVVAYLLTAVTAPTLSSFAAPAVLLRVPAVMVAFLAVVAGYVLISLRYGPRVDKRALPEAENREEAFANLVVARRTAKESYAQKARWWHHVFGALSGFAYGLLLAVAMLWLFS